MTKCNKTNKLKQCHKYNVSDKEACISYNKYQTVNKYNHSLSKYISSLKQKGVAFKTALPFKVYQLPKTKRCVI